MPLNGTVTTSANLSQTYSGTLNTSGSTTKLVKKNLIGTLENFSGSVSYQVVDLQDLAGILDSFTGLVTTTVAYTKSLGGTISFSGSETKKTTKDLTGSLIFGGGVVDIGEAFFKAIAGVLGFSGNVSSDYIEGTPLRNLIHIGETGIAFSGKFFRIGKKIFFNFPEK